MNDPTFVKVRNDQGNVYDSYDIYWRLVELSGFPTCELADVDVASDTTYIFTPTNGNVAATLNQTGLQADLGGADWVKRQAKCILWQLEIPGQVDPAIPTYFDEQWVSCRYWQTVSPDSKFVVLGGDGRLGIEPKEPKKWDFCHLAYLYGKRAQQVAALEAEGYTMAPIGWGEARAEAVAHSKWGLIMHQNPVPALSPQRMTLFACSKLPMVAEMCDPYPYEVAWFDTFNRTQNSTQADANYAYFTETMTFRKAVEGAL